VAEQEARLDRLLAESLRLGLWLCTAAASILCGCRSPGSGCWPPAATEPLPGGTLAQLLALFDDYHALAELLCQLLPEPASGRRGPRCTSARWASRGEPGVPVGLSLVGCRVQPADDPRIAAVAMLGPDRMDYEAVIPLVEYAARALAARASE
jgi:heat-inducible transcriptional repressor